MTPTFHEFRNGMSVMDDRRCVATARPVGSGGWMLSLKAACWTDPRARTQGLVPGKYPNLMHVKTRREAREMLRAISVA